MANVTAHASPTNTYLRYARIPNQCRGQQAPQLVRRMAAFAAGPHRWCRARQPRRTHACQRSLLPGEHQIPNLPNRQTRAVLNVTLVADEPHLWQACGKRYEDFLSF